MIVTYLGNNTRNIRTGIGYEQPMIGNFLLCIIGCNSSHSKENCSKYRVTAENKARGTYKIVQRNMYTQRKTNLPSGLIEILFILFINTNYPS